MRGWPAEVDAKLRELWLAGVFVRRIGVELGRSRSTIICRARRIGLPPRAQPVMALAGVARVPVALVQPEMLPDPAAPGRPRQPLRLWLVPTGPVRECQFPIGEPRTAGFRFCLAPAVAGKPYCLRHARIAFVGFGLPRGEAGYSWVSP